MGYTWHEQDYSYLFEVLQQEFPEWSDQELKEYIESSIDTTVHTPTISIEDNNQFVREYYESLNYVDFYFILHQIDQNSPGVSYDDKKDFAHQTLSERKKEMQEKKRKEPNNTFSEWEPLKQYIIGDTVTHYDRKYICVIDHTSLYDSSAFTGEEFDAGAEYDSASIGHCTTRPGSSPHALFVWRKWKGTQASPLTPVSGKSYGFH